jgi:hypothetical protein
VHEAQYHAGRAAFQSPAGFTTGESIPRAAWIADAIPKRVTQVAVLRAVSSFAAHLVRGKNSRMEYFPGLLEQLFNRLVIVDQILRSSGQILHSYLIRLQPEAAI